MKQTIKLLTIIFNLFGVIFLAYWCGTHEWVKFNNLAELSILSWISLLFFSYLFLSFVFKLYIALKPIDSTVSHSEKHTNTDTFADGS